MAAKLDIAAICPTLVDHDGITILPHEAIDGKFVALYFSASWCLPCRQFTPLLVSVYTKLKATGKPFEVIFVSSDRNQASFDEYFGQHHPWLAVPWASAAGRSSLASANRVAGIPTVVIVGPDGTVVAPNARSAIASDPNGSNFPWAGSSEKGGGLVHLLLLFLCLWWLARWLIGSR